MVLVLGSVVNRFGIGVATKRPLTEWGHGPAVEVEWEVRGVDIINKAGRKYQRLRVLKGQRSMHVALVVHVTNL